ncbi:MAG: response regulator, partial [Syntrophomonadaceae bacterium]|nr:response regulator [Syntrophomonadaceae bacterium]
MVKVLIADDNREFCEILKEYLESQNDFELVGIANNGLETLDIIREKQPHIVVLDIIMP